MNVTNQDQVLSEGTTIAHGEPTVWAATIDDQKPESRQNMGFCKELRDVRAGARPNPSVREAQAVEELIADYQRRHIPDSAASQGKDDGCPPGQISAIPGGYSGRVALGREQCDMAPLLQAAWFPARP
jgi:hypothetical protein